MYAVRERKNRDLQVAYMQMSAGVCVCVGGAGGVLSRKDHELKGALSSSTRV